jgi:hypothetical protein
MWPGAAGATALQQVQFLASKVSESNNAMDESKYSLRRRRQIRMQSANDKNSNTPFNQRRKKANNKKNSQTNANDPVGQGGGVFNNAEFNTVAQKADTSKLKRSDLEVSSSDQREEQVWTALANLELDSKCNIEYSFHMFRIHGMLATTTVM